MRAIFAVLFGTGLSITSIKRKLPAKNFLLHINCRKNLTTGLVKEKGYEWLSSVCSMVRAEALKDFGLSLKAYKDSLRLSKRNKNSSSDKFKPKFKKKGKSVESFRIFKKNDSVFKVHSAHDFSVVAPREKGKDGKMKNTHLHIHPLESAEFLKSADIKTCTFSMKGRKVLHFDYV